MPYAFKLNDNLVKHLVFEASNDNYPNSNIVVLSVSSLKKANELATIWSGVEIIDYSEEKHDTSRLA